MTSVLPSPVGFHFLTVEEAAQRCGVTEGELKGLVDDGRMWSTPEGKIYTGHSSFKRFEQKCQLRAKKALKSQKKTLIEHVNKKSKTKEIAQTVSLPEAPIIRSTPVQYEDPYDELLAKQGKIPPKVANLPAAYNGQDFFASKQDADIARIREQIISLQLKNEQQRFQLVPRDDVRRVFNEVYSIEATEFRALGDRVSPAIASIAAIERPELVMQISALISKEVNHALEHIDVLIKKFLDSLTQNEQ
jgi:hypothetical protein